MTSNRIDDEEIDPWFNRPWHCQYTCVRGEFAIRRLRLYGVSYALIVQQHLRRKKMKEPTKTDSGMGTEWTEDWWLPGFTTSRAHSGGSACPNLVDVSSAAITEQEPADLFRSCRGRHFAPVPRCPHSLLVI